METSHFAASEDHHRPGITMVMKLLSRLECRAQRYRPAAAAAGWSGGLNLHSNFCATWRIISRARRWSALQQNLVRDGNWNGSDEWVRRNRFWIIPQCEARVIKTRMKCSHLRHRDGLCHGIEVYYQVRKFRTVGHEVMFGVNNYNIITNAV